jgi:HK97 family phage prohead protease
MSKQRNKPILPQYEVRVIRNTQRIEVRKNADGSSTAKGYFATYGTMSHNLGFREVIAQGAFDASLRENPVSCFRDHSAEMLLGRTESGTLKVSSDSVGLRFSVRLPKGVSYADDLVILLERGDAFENSFAFSVDGPDGDEWKEQPDGTYLRTLKKVILYEGSILTGNPAAYPGTSVDLRSCPVALRNKLSKRDSEDDDPDDHPGQHWDSDLDEWVDDDDSDSDDDESEDFRCSYRCMACRSADMTHLSNLAEDNPAARSKKVTRSATNLSEDDLIEEAKRCAFRCDACRSLLSGHFPTALAEDDADARAHKHLLSLRCR